MIKILLGLLLMNPLGIQSLIDAPEKPIKRDRFYTEPATYHAALNSWKSIEEINLWIKNSFSYDMEKALKISEEGSSPKPTILSPTEFYTHKNGICVDLARFARETTIAVEPEANPQYLMIEFEPLRQGKSVLRRHWIVIYQREGDFYSFADSKRPGYISGPHKTIDALIKDYESYRKRRILDFKILDSYEKQRARKLKRARIMKSIR
jgi:hypothetical protein